MMNAARRIAPWLAAGCGIVLLASLFARADDAPPAKLPDAPPTLKGKIDEVTVYRGQALVTRLIEIPGPAGLREIVVSDLPEHIQSGSLYAESADGVEVRSVRYFIRPVERDVREEVRKLDEQIRELQDQLQATSQEAKVLADHTSYLNKLEQFTAPTANAELTKGVLNAETLKALTSFLFEQRQTIAKQQLSTSFKQRDINEHLALVNRQREVLTGGSAKTIREAVVFLEMKNPGGKLWLRYLVDGATWDPSYNIRTDAGHQQVLVEFNAAIEQMSGEDWNDVKMSLSTATPSLVANAPTLEPLTIALSAGAPQNRNPSGAEYFNAKKELAVKQRQLEVGRGVASFRGPMDLNDFQSNGGAAPSQQPAQQTQEIDSTLNDVARDSQVLDLVNTDKVDRAAKPTSEAGSDGVSVSYQLPARTSLPSRSDRQLIQIAALPMKAEFYKKAIPVLTSYVYDEASVVNSSKLVLLAGPTSTYLAGQFVGHGQVPTVAVGESFTVGLGIDSSLRARRELIKKSESIQGGNRVVDFTYQLTLENFGAEATDVRLLDRMPTGKESEVKLTLVSPGKDLSTDARYLQHDRKKGLLRWDLKVPGQAIGPKALTIDYQMQMEYDKQLSIAGLPLTK